MDTSSVNAKDLAASLHRPRSLRRTSRGVTQFSASVEERKARQASMLARIASDEQRKAADAAPKEVAKDMNGILPPPGAVVSPPPGMESTKPVELVIETKEVAPVVVPQPEIVQTTEVVAAPVIPASTVVAPAPAVTVTPNAAPATSAPAQPPAPDKEATQPLARPAKKTAEPGGPPSVK